MNKRMLSGLLASLALMLLVSPAHAAEEPAFEALGTGILTRVPSETQGTLRLGSRVLRAGDAVAEIQLPELSFTPAEGSDGEAVIACLSLTDEGTEETELTLSLGKNQPPVAEDSDFETYRNIPGEVRLTASDPEGDTLTVTITRQPKRGDLTISEEGTITYTPKENKVGKDSFSYTVTDTEGQTSEEATVRIQIQKPHDKATYGDMVGDPAELAAVWLREAGLFSGETVSGQALFQPELPVSRGEFLAMCAGLQLDADDAEAVSTGFADEAETPAWLRPFVTTALKCGYLQGIPGTGGLTLQADAPMTQAQAARLVSTMLGLQPEDAQTVMAVEDSVPTWASGSAAALLQQGLYTVTDPEAQLTRREAAMLLHSAYGYTKNASDGTGLLNWAMK